MPRYQSRLFNWIDRSLPVKLGRRVRRFYNNLFTELGQLPNYIIRDLNTIARVATLRLISTTFYPLYRLGAIAKSKLLLPSATANHSSESANDTNNGTKNHLLGAKLQADRSLPTNQNGQIEPIDYFQEVWQNGHRHKSSPMANSPAKLTEGDRLNTLNSNLVANGSDPMVSNGNGAMSDPSNPDATWRSPQFNPAHPDQDCSLPLNYWQKLGLRLGLWVEHTYILAEVELGITVLSESELFALNTLNNISLARLEQSDYTDYIDRHNLSLSNRQSLQLAKHSRDQDSLANRSQQIDRPSNNFDQQSINYIRTLIKAAIAYFFGGNASSNQISNVATDSATRSTMSAAKPTNGQPWLSMAELFGDDNSHWPPLQHQQTSNPGPGNASQSPELRHPHPAAIADPWSYPPQQSQAIASTPQPVEQSKLEPISKHLDPYDQIIPHANFEGERRSMVAT
jgi:hypothetical protein